MKKTKECEHCTARFKNRKQLRNHLIFFHKLVSQLRPHVKKIVTRFSTDKPVSEGKPHRRWRMEQHAAKVKKGRERVAKAGQLKVNNATNYNTHVKLWRANGIR